MSLDRKLRAYILVRDNCTCQYCGVQMLPSVLHVDHVLPISKGGGHAEKNLKTSCMPCNMKKRGIAPKLSDSEKRSLRLGHVPEATTSFRIGADVLALVRAAAVISGRSVRCEIGRVLRECFHSKPKGDGR